MVNGKAHENCLTLLQDLQTPQAPDSHMMGYGEADDGNNSQVVLQTDLYQQDQHHFQGY